MRKIAKFIRLFILGVVFSLILSGCNSMTTQTNGTNSRSEEKIQIVATIAQIGDPDENHRWRPSGSEEFNGTRSGSASL